MTFLLIRCLIQVHSVTLLAFDLLDHMGAMDLVKSGSVIIQYLKGFTSGPGCSKLTTVLVNETLKFQTLISQIHVCQYFLLKKCEKLLQCKSFSHFFKKKNIIVLGYKVVKHLTS